MFYVFDFLKQNQLIKGVIWRDFKFFFLFGVLQAVCG